MTDLLSKHPEFIVALIGLIIALTKYLNERTHRIAAQRSALVLGNAIEKSGSPHTKRVVHDNVVRLRHQGRDRTAKLVQEIAATVDERKVTPDPGLGKQYQALKDLGL